MSIHQTISQLANQCVLCGLCLPHCPTYQLFHTENESPRGRISLFKALAEGSLEFNEAVLEPLDHCLACRACEKMCPSQVNYSSINQLGRQLIAAKSKINNIPKHQTLLQRLSEKLLINSSLHPLIKKAATIISPVLPYFHKLLTGNRYQSFIMTINNELIANTSRMDSLNKTCSVDESITKAKGQVLLFKGCSGDLFEQQNLTDSIKLLNACHFNVKIPHNQQCCGALKLRHGDIDGMHSLAQKNIAEFSPLLSDYEAIIALNNSCSAQLKEYAGLEIADALSGAEALAEKASDLIAFLHQHCKGNNIQFAPLEQEVAVHSSCSLKNVLKEEQLLYELLALIPGIKLRKFNSQFCCGAAGSYMLQYPDVSNQLLNDKIDDIRQNNYQLIVSSNISCSLHFKQGLRQFGQNVEVIHPVSLLARQLLDSGRW